jgi:hypothetical protein
MATPGSEEKKSKLVARLDNLLAEELENKFLLELRDSVRASFEEVKRFTKRQVVKGYDGPVFANASRDSEKQVQALLEWAVEAKLIKADIAEDEGTPMKPVKQERAKEDLKVTRSETQPLLYVHDGGCDLYVVGVTRSGKSAFCNRLSNSSVFDEAFSARPVTSKVRGVEVVLRDQARSLSKTITLFDTPGFGDGNEGDYMYLISKSMSDRAKRPVAFALILNYHDAVNIASEVLDYLRICFKCGLFGNVIICCTRVPLTLGADIGRDEWVKEVREFVRKALEVPDAMKMPPIVCLCDSKDDSSLGKAYFGLIEQNVMSLPTRAYNEFRCRLSPGLASKIEILYRLEVSSLSNATKIMEAAKLLTVLEEKFVEVDFQVSLLAIRARVYWRTTEMIIDHLGANMTKIFADVPERAHVVVDSPFLTWTLSSGRKLIVTNSSKYSFQNCMVYLREYQNISEVLPEEAIKKLRDDHIKLAVDIAGTKRILAQLGQSPQVTDFLRHYTLHLNRFIPVQEYEQKTKDRKVVSIFRRKIRK